MDIKKGLAITQANTGQASAAIQSLSLLRSNADPSIAAQADAATIYSLLYQPPPYGCENAISLGEKLLSDRPNDPERLWIHSLLAAAYGQKYANAPKGNAGEAERKEARGRALEHAREAVKDQRWKVLLQQLSDPIRFGGSPTDNDLAVFANDPEFISLLELR